MKKFMKFKKINDCAFMLCTIIASFALCVQPEIGDGRMVQDILLIVAAVIGIVAIICKTLAYKNKKRYLNELRNALKSVLH